MNKIFVSNETGAEIWGYDFVVSHGARNGTSVPACRNTGTIFARLYRRQTPKTFLLLLPPLQRSIASSNYLNQQKKKRRPPIEPAGAKSPARELPNDVKPFVSMQQTGKKWHIKNVYPNFKVSKLYFNSEYR